MGGRLGVEGVGGWMGVSLREADLRSAEIGGKSRRGFDGGRMSDCLVALRVL